MLGISKSKRGIAAGAIKDRNDREIARRFGKAFFDGDRRHGYGGFHCIRFWEPVIPALQQFYDLKAGSRVLDVGCARVYALRYIALDTRYICSRIGYWRLCHRAGYARDETLLTEGNATDLPYEDDAFDLVISINTLHNLEGALSRKHFLK